MSSIIRNIKLEKKDYEDLLLTSLVDTKLIEHIKIIINKINPNTKETYTKETTIKVGDMVEIISLNQLNLIYTFGKIKRINFKQNFIFIDISDDYDSASMYINIADIRDIAIYNGDFKLYPLNNDINNSYTIYDECCDTDISVSNTYTVYDDATDSEIYINDNEDDGYQDDEGFECEEI